MALFATVLAHLLVLFLIIVVPIRGARRYRVLMRRIARHPELRFRFYLSGILGQWLLVIPVVIIAFGLAWSPQFLGFQLPQSGLLFGAISAVIILIFYAQIFYIRRAAGTVEGRVQLRQSMSGPLHMLPRTPKERALWVLLSLTAGFCEELLYRGFLPAYLTHIFPGMNFLLALVVSAALFGLGHIYQKVTGVLGTGLMGLLFGLLYYFTGSLFLPMIVHALFDLRLLLLDVPAIVDAPIEPPLDPPNEPYSQPT